MNLDRQRHGGIEPLADVLPQDDLSFPDGADVGRRETASLVLMSDGRQRTQPAHTGSMMSLSRCPFQMSADVTLLLAALDLVGIASGAGREFLNEDF